VFLGAVCDAWEAVANNTGAAGVGASYCDTTVLHEPHLLE